MVAREPSSPDCRGRRRGMGGTGGLMLALCNWMAEDFSLAVLTPRPRTRFRTPGFRGFAVPDGRHPLLISELFRIENL